MPNYVYNHISVTGNSREISNLIARAKSNESDFDFNSFVPMPDDVFKGDLGEREEKMYPGEKNWYGWSKKYWGVKWNCSDAFIFQDDTQNNNQNTRIDFTTAWSVPEALLISVSTQYPELKFVNEWIEESLDSAGVIELTNGVVTRSDYETYIDYKELNSRYLHEFNLKYKHDYYLELLEEYHNDDESNECYSHYLNLARN